MVAYAFPPMAYVGAHRTLRFCRYLPREGWIPYVLTIKEAKDLDNDHKLLERVPKEVKVYRTNTIDFWRMWGKWSKRKKILRSGEAKVTLTEANLNRDKKQSWLKSLNRFLWDLFTIPDHMVFWIPFAVLKGIQILCKEKCDLIYTSSPPHSEHIIGLILSKLFKKPWVADFRDPWLDNFNYAPPKLRLWVDKLLEKVVINQAFKVIIVSKYYMQLLFRRYPSADKKIFVLENGFDPKIIKNSSVEYFDKFTILYAGSFYGTIKPDFFIKGFEKWLRTYHSGTEDNIQVLFYGYHSDEAKQIVKEGGLNSVIHFGGLIPQDELIPKEKGAQLLLLIIGFDEKSKGVVTSKVFEYMACRRPILAIVPEGEAADILKGYDDVYMINQMDESLLVESINKAFKRYLSHELVTTSNEMKASKIENKYDARYQTRTLAGIFETLSRKNRCGTQLSE